MPPASTVSPKTIKELISRGGLNGISGNSKTFVIRHGGQSLVCCIFPTTSPSTTSLTPCPRPRAVQPKRLERRVGLVRKNEERKKKKPAIIVSKTIFHNFLNLNRLSPTAGKGMVRYENGRCIQKSPNVRMDLMTKLLLTVEFTGELVEDIYGFELITLRLQGYEKDFSSRVDRAVTIPNVLGVPWRRSGCEGRKFYGAVRHADVALKGIEACTFHDLFDIMDISNPPRSKTDHPPKVFEACVMSALANVDNVVYVGYLDKHRFTYRTGTIGDSINYLVAILKPKGYCTMLAVCDLQTKDMFMLDPSQSRKTKPTQSAQNLATRMENLFRRQNSKRFGKADEWTVVWVEELAAQPTKWAASAMIIWYVCHFLDTNLGIEKMPPTVTTEELTNFVGGVVLTLLWSQKLHGGGQNRKGKRLAAFLKEATVKTEGDSEDVNYLSMSNIIF